MKTRHFLNLMQTRPMDPRDKQVLKDAAEEINALRGVLAEFLLVCGKHDTGLPTEKATKLLRRT